jgi:hypothetical protein
LSLKDNLGGEDQSEGISDVYVPDAFPCDRWLRPDFLDVAQSVQRYRKDVWINADVKLQEYGAYLRTTVPPGWEPDSVLVYCGCVAGVCYARHESSTSDSRPKEGLWHHSSQRENRRFNHLGKAAMIA